MKRKWLVLLTLGALSCLSSRAETGTWMNLNGSGIFCRQLSETVVMRDPSSCGATTIFCSVPVQCFQGQSSFVTTVMCRAKKDTPIGILDKDGPAALSVAPRTGILSCPSLQRCADDPEPQIAYESDLPKWSIPGFAVRIDDMIFPAKLGH